MSSTTPTDTTSSSTDTDDFITLNEYLDNPNENLQLKLHTKHLLSSQDKTSNELGNLCINKIAESVFKNGMYDILNIIIDNVEYNKLQQIHNIVKNIKLDHDQKTNENNDSLSSSSFCMLPTECIMNICTNLDRNEITSLKVVSYDIGTICLQHMMRISFGICNVNKFIKHPNFYNQNIQHLHNQSMTYLYYNAFTKYMQLQQHWQLLYNIPIKYQLFYDYRKGKIKYLNLSKNKSIQQISKRYRSHFLFDKRHIIIICKDQSPEIYAKMNNDLLYNMSEYKLCILYYFDQLNQQSQIIQPILFHKEVTYEIILEYIQHKFIATIDEQYIWYDRITQLLQTNSLSRPQLILYKYMKQNQHRMSKVQNGDKIVTHSRYLNYMYRLIVEINNCETLNEEINKRKKEYEMVKDKFCLHANEFWKKFRDPFMLSLKYIHDLSLLKSQLKYLSNDDSKMMDIKIENMDFTFEISKYCTDDQIKLKMCVKINEMLNFNIISDNIRLYDGSDSYCINLLSSNTRKLSRDIIGDIYFGINDIHLLCSYIHVLIFPNQFVLPLMGKNFHSNHKYSITMKYKHEFKIGNQFIQDIMNEITKPIYGQHFDDILNIYKQNNISFGVYAQNKAYKFGSEYKYQGSAYSLRYMRTNDYSESSSIPLLYLFMYSCNENEGNNIKVTFRFWIKTQYLSVTRRRRKRLRNKIVKLRSLNELTVVPVTVWVKNGNTLKDIIQNLFGSQMGYKWINFAFLYDEKIDEIEENNYNYEFKLINKTLYTPTHGDILILEIGRVSNE